MDDSHGLRVECYAGHRADERPLRFHLDDRLVEVVAVLDRWLGPDHRYFKVTGDDDDTYILRHDTAADRWDLTVFSRAGTPGRSVR
jgi:hypothetical protein